MPSKQQLDKAAWDWTLVTDPQKIKAEHIECAYRLKVLPCKTACRRNCKGNPHCLSGLGEKNWMNEIADEEWHEIDDPNSERREEGSFVGLKNLGATCYVNSLLQVWYHNVNFRYAIYKWKPGEDPQEKDTFSEGESFSPVSCIGHLQLIFALLQFSCRKYIDPTPFITMLGLNATQQQDAQEFCQLFISLLEEKLSHQSEVSCRNIVQEQYSGEYAYITRCHKCHTESLRPSQFFGLDLGIKGHKDLFECLDEFCQEEKLEGNDQYYCSICQSKQDATRFIRLKRLPPVLHLQLLRFVFDRQTGCRKKLNSFIRFPEVLDMSRYLHQVENTTVYEVSAVLIHRGVSAHSGHYVAHIKDAESTYWFKFNDETVEKIVGKKLKLGTEENLTEEKAVSKAPKALKGWHSSNNAYMLVYTLRDNKPPQNLPQNDSEILPVHLQISVLEDNSSFEEWVKELAIMREQNVTIGKERQSDIRKIYEKLPIKDCKNYEFINTNWLKKWLTSNSGAVSPVDNSHCLCPHEKLSPDGVDKVKCISKEGAEEIYKKYGGGPRLGEESFCRKCVEARCHIMRVKARLKADQKVFTNLLKAKLNDDEEAFWIGKSSLRSWRRLVLLQNEDLCDSQQEDGPDEDNNNENETGNDGGNNADAMGDEDEEDVKFLFNEDLLCEHGNLKVNEGSRRLLKEEAWTLLRQYFPDAPEFKRATPLCTVCLRQRDISKQTKEQHRQLALEQKSALSDLYLDKCRPPFAKLENNEPVFAVSQTFLEEWRKFIKDPVRREPITEIGNASLLCHHRGLPFLLDEVNLPDNCLAFLWQKEWDLLKSQFVLDVEIRVYRKSNESGVSSWNSSPEICEECLLASIAAREQQELNYSNAKIYIRRVSKLDAAEPGQTGGDADYLTEDYLPDLYSGDDEAQPVAHKKARLCPEADGGNVDWIPGSLGEKEATAPNPESTPTMALSHVADVTGSAEKTALVAPKLVTNGLSSNGGGGGFHSTPEMRRSSRRRKLRGEKEMYVSSSQSLKDLKVQIMREFSVAPFDQNLSLNGKPLRDNMATLSTLRIVPGSLILLKADEVGEEAIVMEDYIKSTTPETGFKGTGLLSS